MRVWLKRMVPAVLGLLLLIQLIRPATVNPPIYPAMEMSSHLAIEPAVQSIFNRSCNDCHSNRTVWPWYSHVAPVSWLVASDVHGGRRHVNFSEWGTYPTEKSGKMLDEICKEVREGDMPPIQYTPMHPAARLTKTDREQVCRWMAAMSRTLAAGDGVNKP